MSSADLDARLRAVGLRSTRQRLTVLGALDATHRHRSADELVGDLADRGTALPRSTVFNVLDDLVAAGLVLRAELGPGATRYESAISRSPHHHFVCVVCGAIEDVAADASSRRLAAPVLAAGHLVDRVEVVLRGRCRDCLEAGSPGQGDRGEQRGPD